MLIVISKTYRYLIGCNHRSNFDIDNIINDCFSEYKISSSSCYYVAAVIACY
jgi:hypothetical protein